MSKMKFRTLSYLCKALFIFHVILVSGCSEESFPEFISKPYSETKRLNLIFVDKADPSSSVGIYVNNKLLSTNNQTGAKGLQYLDIPDSLIARTLSIALAEFKTATPPSVLMVDDLIYETFILPSELKGLSTIAFSRDNPASTITASKSGVSDELAPEPGYFKVRFYNISGNTLDVYRRNGTLFSEFANLNSLEDRPYIQLPFGFYRFIIRKDNDDKNIDNISPILNGEAGKIYTVFCTDIGQVVTELGDYGVPANTFAYVGFVNLIPNDSKVIVLPIKGSTRKESLDKVYTKFDGVELLPSGMQTVNVEVNGLTLSAQYDLKPYDYLMVYITEHDGKPELQLIPTPLGEPGLEQINARYINFSGDADTVTFVRIRTDFDLGNATESPSNVLSYQYSANLKFGEIRTTKSTEYANSIYTQYSITRSTNDSNGSPFIIQAYEATTMTSRLGAPIANTRVDFPFFITKPDQDVTTYSGYGGEPGVYTVILTGKKDAGDSKLQSKITIISHSF